MLQSNGLRAFLQRFLLIGAGFALFAAEAIAADYGMHGLAAPAAAGVGLEAAVTADASDVAADPDPSDAGEGYERLPGHTLDIPAAAGLAAESPASSRQPLQLTFVFKRDDPQGFERYLKDVYDPASPQFRHFLTQSALTRRFGPSSEVYAQTIRYLRARGLHVEHESKNHLTLTVRGPRAAVEKALRLKLQDWTAGGRTFYAASTDPGLPIAIGSHVLAIEGLSNRATPAPALRAVKIYYCGGKQQSNGTITVNTSKQKNCVKVATAVIPLFANILCALSLMAAGGAANAATGATAFYAGAGVTGGGIIYNSICPFTNFPQNYNNFTKSLTSRVRSAAAIHAKSAQPAVSTAGAGQKIGLLEFDTFQISDVSDYLSLIGAPASQLGNLSVVPVNGGVAAPGSGESEVLMDIDTVMALAPAAKVVVYDAPFSGQAGDYSSVFNAMINDGVTVISNSWASCEDQVSQAEAAGVDAVLQTAAASGISVFNGAGDSGSTCLDGSANTISMPADSPNATAVGGTSLPNGFGQGGTYNGESWWDGSNDTPPTGQGGFGVSRYFARPAYQSGLNSGSQRSIPDVSILADPAYGLVICQQDNGGCPNGESNGGTSLAAPEWAALAALINQAQGRNTGSFNALLYPLANTDAFHSATSMGSDFQHVGLGSPNLIGIVRHLKGQTVGAPVAANSTINVMPPEINATFKADASFSVPADGATPAGVIVNLVDANGNTVPGKTVTLTAASGSAVISAASGPSSADSGAVVFTLTDLTAETITLTATDTTDGLTLPPVTVTFGVPPAANAGISANPPTVAADGQSTATITVTLTDALNRPSPGKTISISDGGAHAVVTGPSPGVTDANGQIQFTATDQVDETVTFTATDVTDAGLPIPGSGVVTYSNSTSTACGVGTVPTAGTGYGVTQFITGLPAASTVFYQNVNFGCPGANNPAFTSGGSVLVSDFLTGGIYQTGLAGGAVTSSSLVNTVSPALGGLVYGKDGSLYATQGGGNGQILQIDPTTGATLRTVASGLICPAGLSVDPLSGDLFFDDQCTGAGDDNASIWRVIDPANSDPSNPTSVVVYATLPSTPNGGMAFAPNGTLYAVSGYYYSQTAPVEAISGTNATTVTVTPVTGVTSNYAVAVGVTNTDGSAQSLIVAPNGTLSEVPIANPSAATTISTGIGIGVTGPDGCLYSAAYDTIYKITNASGGCNFAPTSPAPYLTLSASPTSPSPAAGSSVTLTAVVHNVATLSGLPVAFNVVGENLVYGVAPTDATGTATFSYVSPSPGKDSALASVAPNSTQLYSNVANYTWVAGQDVTELSVNSSPHGATVGVAVTVSATLVDESKTTPSGVAGQSVTFTAAGGSCTATTTSAGVASCSLTPTQIGLGTLTGTFSGTSTLAANTTTAAFTVSGTPAPVPTVTLTVSPTNVAAGASATLTWASTNATACTASGAWSGSEATSGTETVTPSATGSYSYTLTCTGNGGTATATAVLSATLATVTVTAHSGGGAMSGILLALLGLLVLLRIRAGRHAIAGIALCLALGLAALGGSGVVRADPAAATDVDSVLDHVYVGLRAGTMPINLSDAHLDAGLAAAGYGEVAASTHDSAFGGTLYLGYELAPHADLEFAYTHRDSRVATLSGTVASSASFAPLVQDAAGLIRGYGNIFAVSFRGRLEVAPRVFIDPRIGVFCWDTKVTAAAPGAIFDTNHSGGGLTLGIGAAYRVWRGLEIGAGVDYFDGSPNNSAVLYAGTLEWRFGTR